MKTLAYFPNFQVAHSAGHFFFLDVSIIFYFSSGVEHGNLRELALARMKDFGTDCRDVRTREVGIQEIHNKIQPYEVELIRRDYTANNGWETFLSYEDPTQDILVGLLRLRKCSDETFRCVIYLKKLRKCIVQSFYKSNKNWILLKRRNSFQSVNRRLRAVTLTIRNEKIGKSSWSILRLYVRNGNKNIFSSLFI